MVKYVQMNNFEDMCKNQTQLIGVLNHRMTGLEGSVGNLKSDVKWIKVIGLYLCGIISALTIATITKLIIGN